MAHLEQDAGEGTGPVRDIEVGGDDDFGLALEGDVLDAVAVAAEGAYGFQVEWCADRLPANEVPECMADPLLAGGDGGRRNEGIQGVGAAQVGLSGKPCEEIRQTARIGPVVDLLGRKSKLEVGGVSLIYYA